MAKSLLRHMNNEKCAFALKTRVRTTLRNRKKMAGIILLDEQCKV